jgi:WD40 repeat protein/lipoprotein NlpI
MSRPLIPISIARVTLTLSVALGLTATAVGQSSRAIRTLAGHTGLVKAVAFAPDGKRLATGSQDTTVRVWDVETGTLKQTLALTPSESSDWINGVAFSPDGRAIAAVTESHRVVVWNADTGAQQWTSAEHKASVDAVAFSPDGRSIVTGGFDKTMKLWDVRTGTVVKTIGPLPEFVFAVAFSPDGTTIASGSRTSVQLWNLQTGTARQVSGELAWAVAFSPDGGSLAISRGTAGQVAVLDVPTGTTKWTEAKFIGGVNGLAFSRDGMLAVASGDFDAGEVTLMNAKTGVKAQTLRGHASTVYSVAFSPDGHTLASGSSDKTIRLWDLSTGAILTPSPPSMLTEARTLTHTLHVDCVAFAPNASVLVSGAGNSARMWDTSTGALLQTMETENGVNAIAFSPDGSLAAGAALRNVYVWQVPSGAEKLKFQAHPREVTSVAFSADGRLLATTGGYQDNSVRLWSVATAGGALTVSPVRTLTGHTETAMSVAFSPDNRTLASGSDDGTVRLWDVESGTLRVALKGAGNVRTLTFSSSGEWLAAGGYGLKMWNARTQNEQWVNRGGGPIHSVAFSPDGTLLAVGDADGVLRLRDAASGAIRERVVAHTGVLSSLSFAPNGRLLATAGDDKLVKVWMIGPAVTPAPMATPPPTTPPPAAPPVAKPTPPPAARPPVPPQDVTAILKRASDASDAKRWDDAVKAYQEAIALQPANADAHFSLGLAFTNLGRWKDADESFSEVTRLQPTNATAYFWRGNARLFYPPGAFMFLGNPYKYAPSIDDLAKALSLDPRMIEVYHVRAWINLAAEKDDAALGDARAYVNASGWRTTASPYAVFAGYLGARHGKRDADAKALIDECAAKCDQTKWPYPVVRYFRREITAQQLLDQATDNDKMTEARTYRGMDLALAGKAAEARDDFQWVYSNGNKRFYEWALAQGRLAAQPGQPAPVPTPQQYSPPGGSRADPNDGNVIAYRLGIVGRMQSEKYWTASACFRDPRRLLPPFMISR